MLTTNPSFTVLDTVDSTNNYAMAKVHAGLAIHGDAWFSFNQTSGKGQRTKNWHAGNRQNIALSIVVVPKPLSMYQQFKLSAIVALACFDFFSFYAGGETKIKWPNDIYWRDRKAAGILIENVIGASISKNQQRTDETADSLWKYAVVGIGININQTAFDGELKAAVSLKQITGKDSDIVALAKELHLLVLNRVDEFLRMPFEKILEQYNELLFKKDEMVRLKKGNIIFDTMIKSVTQNGQLFTIDNIHNFFNFGEVEWLL
ncbi:MAG: biotin--[acetyl-CoA-carboxylase] ligase [Ferruginibacter sp.]|nr:biotin--[acetyl-CoA-carboxylase] ligase [Ferruginibacter sp.]